jgi:hypothetical protein
MAAGGESGGHYWEEAIDRRRGFIDICRWCGDRWIRRLLDPLVAYSATALDVGSSWLNFATKSNSADTNDDRSQLQTAPSSIGS